MNHSLSVIEYFALFRDREIPIVIDDYKYINTLSKLGFKTVLFDDYNFKSNNIIFLLITSFEYQEKIRALWDNSNSIICLLSIAKFLPSIKNVQYTLTNILDADLKSILKIRDSAYEYVNNNDRLEVNNINQNFEVDFYDEINVGNFETEFRPGFLYSVPELFEASFVNFDSQGAGYNINGKFSFDGIITAAVNSQVRRDFNERLGELYGVINAAKSKHLIVENNEVVSLIINEKESHLLGSFEFEIGRQVTEFAFGCNQNLYNIDWRINSVSNEGVYGTHIGLGLGQTAPHIDFIARDLMPIY